MINRRIKLAPSILSADFSRLGEQLAEIPYSDIDYIHIDIMDGHFVPNISVGPLVIESIKKISKVPLDVHLMIEKPINFLKEVHAAGADIITVHIEAESHTNRVIDIIKGLGCKAGVSLNPSTSLYTLDEILASVDLVLIMSVNPGFGGQKFIDSSLDKIKRLRKVIDDRNAAIEIEVDGGITIENASNVVKAGADILVAGNTIFSNPDIQGAIKEFRASLEKIN